MRESVYMCSLVLLTGRRGKTGNTASDMWIDKYGVVWSHPDVEPTEEDMEAEREIDLEWACRARTPPRRRKARKTIPGASVPIVKIMKDSSGRIIGCVNID